MQRLLVATALLLPLASFAGEVVAGEGDASRVGVEDSLYSLASIPHGKKSFREAWDIARDEETGKSPCVLNIWGTSYHLERPTLLNEKNWGLGLRCFRDEHRFAEVNVVRNSFRGIATTAGVGWDYDFFHVSDVEVHGNIQVLAIDYRYPRYLHKKDIRGLAIFPGTSLHYGPWSAEFTFVPRKSFKKLEVILFHLGYRF